MQLKINYQDSYSRTELLLRTFFGWLYIIIPHAFCLFFLAIWSGILQFITFWVILFTGKFPESFFEYQVKYLRWGIRLNTRVLNLLDGYPAFGLDVEDENIHFEVPYIDQSDRGTVLLRALFGWLYVLVPHGFILFFVGIVVQIFAFLAFWIVLFTKKYPEDFHKFNINYLRWSTRVNLYMMYMTDTYPPFTGEPEHDEDYDNNPYLGPNPALAFDDPFAGANLNDDDDFENQQENPKPPKPEDLV
jgi:hypothetical protein